MNAIELLALARQDFEAKLAMVEDDQWALSTPCTEWNVRALVNHVVAGNLMNVALLFGASTGEARKVWRSDSLGADPRGAFARSADELDTAFREQTDMDRMITHPHGEMSIHDFCACERRTTRSMRGTSRLLFTATSHSIRP